MGYRAERNQKARIGSAASPIVGKQKSRRIEMKDEGNKASQAIISSQERFLQ